MLPDLNVSSLLTSLQGHPTLSIVGFLVASLNLSPDVVDALWSITKDLVWVMPSGAEMDASDEAAFRVHPVF
ncbi:hypothetical protein BDR05DRAFT_964961 [Suillus weaverae]|nr:hypothetical protein BDR05DRAFT_964961 [Suillus weaverae]